MKLKSIRENIGKIKGKKVFLRVDFNAPVLGGKIKDETKILAALPTIRFLLRYRCRIILATHLGDPSLRTASAGKTGGKKKKEFSVKLLAKRLGEILGHTPVKYVGDIAGDKANKEAEKLKAGEILFLENLRFDRGEEKNDRKFAKKLAKLADVYVNEAFSVCHRNHASVSALRKMLPSFSGFLLEEEIANLDKIKNPVKPLVIMMGGAKIKTKINLIKKLGKKATKILIGGALANNFFRAMGLSVGRSLIDKDSVLIAEKLLADKKIILPVDAAVESGKIARRKIIDDIGKNEIIYDIGPETIRLYAEILRGARTIIWNGPLGAFEKPPFRYGTLSLGQVVAARSRGKTFGVVGGGETIEALKMTRMENYIDWISTGGGAMLAYLGGEKMPGLE
jgi:phosphoglycerate kinase